jgi:serine/threonine protein kinase
MSTPIDAGFIALQEHLIGRYSLERELGRGGMGTVYLAREIQLDRPVAIKVLHAGLAADPQGPAAIPAGSPDRGETGTPPHRADLQRRRT